MHTVVTRFLIRGTSLSDNEVGGLRVEPLETLARMKMHAARLTIEGGLFPIRVTNADPLGVRLSDKMRL